MGKTQRPLMRREVSWILCVYPLSLSFLLGSLPWLYPYPLSLFSS